MSPLPEERIAELARTQGYAYWWPHPQQFRPTHWQPLPAAPEPALRRHSGA